MRRPYRPDEPDTFGDLLLFCWDMAKGIGCLVVLVFCLGCFLVGFSIVTTLIRNWVLGE